MCEAVLQTLLYFPMTEAEPGPISRPNSTLGILPPLAQLRFVNAGLEKNSYPREHYSRQFSVTPDRQTPQSQRTPLITWPDADPIEELREAKAWAVKEAKLLERFHAGRVILRKEEPEQYGIFGGDPEYWDSQTSHWKTQYEKLARVYDRRKQLEAEGRAVNGYAQSLFLSPIQSPSPPQSDGVLLATAAGIKKRKPTATRPSKQPIKKTSSQKRENRSPQLSQLTPKNSPNSSSKASRKHTETAKEQDVPEGNSIQASFGTRPPRQMTDPIPKDRPHLVTESALGPRINTSRVSKTTTKKTRRQKNIHLRGPQAPHVLPWTLRSRDAISYRETGTRAASKKKRRPG